MNSEKLHQSSPLFEIDVSKQSIHLPNLLEKPVVNYDIRTPSIEINISFF